MVGAMTAFPSSPPIAIGSFIVIGEGWVRGCFFETGAQMRRCDQCGSDK